MRREDDMIDWIYRDQEAYLIFEDASPDQAYISYIRRGVDEEPRLSPEEEESLMTKQVTESNGFDIDFKQFRCIFNYLPFDLDSTVFIAISETGEQETGIELMDRLSREALQTYNSREEKEYKFMKFIKANFHRTCVAAIKIYITFEAKDIFNDQPKLFQAKVIYHFCQPADFTYCELKPEKNVHSIEAAENENVKKPRLAEEPLTPSGEMQAVV